MRALAPHVIVEGLRKGIRRFQRMPRNSQALQECHNVMPDDAGPKLHETVLSLTDDTSGWPGLGVREDSERLRDIVIHVHEFVSDVELSGVSVYLDDVLKGTTDANGELAISSVETGGHSIKLTKTNYVDSDEDEIANDFIMVT